MSAVTLAAPLARFVSTRPARPYCTDDLATGLRIRPRERALAMRYVQVGSTRAQGWITLDVDRPDAGATWIDAEVPQPTIVIVNPANGHAHLMWELKEPVPLATIGPAARFLAAIERGLSARVGADVAYGGLIAKNPLHDAWDVRTHDVQYSLAELAAHLDQEEIAARPVRALGLGRNVELFDLARQFAYRAVREHAEEPAFAVAIGTFAVARNLAFTTPLGEREVGGIVRSI